MSSMRTLATTCRRVGAAAAWLLERLWCCCLKAVCRPVTAAAAAAAFGGAACLYDPAPAGILLVLGNVKLCIV